MHLTGLEPLWHMSNLSMDWNGSLEAICAYFFGDHLKFFLQFCLLWNRIQNTELTGDSNCMEGVFHEFVEKDPGSRSKNTQQDHLWSKYCHPMFQLLSEKENAHISVSFYYRRSHILNTQPPWLVGPMYTLAGVGHRFYTRQRVTV